jgi:hypothetical protein
LARLLFQSRRVKSGVSEQCEARRGGCSVLWCALSVRLSSLSNQSGQQILDGAQARAMPSSNPKQNQARARDRGAEESRSRHRRRGFGPRAWTLQGLDAQHARHRHRCSRWLGWRPRSTKAPATQRNECLEGLNDVRDASERHYLVFAVLYYAALWCSPPCAW